MAADKHWTASSVSLVAGATPGRAGLILIRQPSGHLARASDDKADPAKNWTWTLTSTPVRITVLAPVQRHTTLVVLVSCLALTSSFAMGAAFIKQVFMANVGSHSPQHSLNTVWIVSANTTLPVCLIESDRFPSLTIMVSHHSTRRFCTVIVVTPPSCSLTDHFIREGVQEHFCNTPSHI